MSQAQNTPCSHVVPTSHMYTTCYSLMLPNNTACPVACPLIYAPVCLENGETASNECVAKCSNSTIKCNYACPCPLPPPPPGSSQTRPMNGTMGPVNGTGPSKPIGPTSRCRSADADLMAPYQCALLPKTGPCRASFQRFFYNASAEECQPFIYGGCQGNTNNFETLDLCNQVCVNPAPTWRCQPACIGQPGCSTNIKCANDTCYPVYGFLDVEPLVLDVNSWYVGWEYGARHCCMTHPINHIPPTPPPPTPPPHPTNHITTKPQVVWSRW